MQGLKCGFSGSHHSLSEPEPENVRRSTCVNTAGPRRNEVDACLILLSRILPSLLLRAGYSTAFEYQSCHVLKIKDQVGCAIAQGIKRE